MKKGFRAVLMGIAAVFLVAAGYFIGYKTAYDSVENMGAAQAADQQTFYAEIREREAGRFLVKGLAVNDLNSLFQPLGKRRYYGGERRSDCLI